ncbi:DnaJ-like protein subfamily C member 2 [Aphelenchoides fujianensis]|nr:DnaJ-like protein subfamily C member 2 [Aphelenchoides fujianensis]
MSKLEDAGTHGKLAQRNRRPDSGGLSPPSIAGAPSRGEVSGLPLGIAALLPALLQLSTFFARSLKRCFEDPRLFAAESKMSDVCTAIALVGFQPLRRRRIELAGIAYECNATLDRLALGLSPAPVLKVEASASACSSTGSSSVDLTNPEDFMDKDDEKYHRYVGKLDPNDFKDQDHYKVLGLSKLRFKATPGQIKTAYRQKVLVYHPDKGKASKNGSRNEAIFACIQKAYEQLGMDDEKRRAYDSVDPKFDDSFPEASDVSAKNFFEVLGPVFERNSRFSIDQPVPQLGDSSSSRADVERFYEFWLRKKYVKKLSATVEMAYEKDPRVQHFNKQDKKAKEDEKERKRLEKQRLAEEAEARRLEEERKAEAELQEQKEAEKVANQKKQQAKKQLQAERRRLRDVVKNKAYFTEDDQRRLEVMECVEGACLNLNLEELSELTNKIEAIDDASTKVVWETDEIQLLIKATNIYPAGSVERWVQVTKYINDHSKNGHAKPKKEKDVIKEVKLMKSAEATAQLANALQKQPVGVQNDPTVDAAKSADAAEVWTAAQQKQLETALKTTDSKDAQRWEKIADQVDGKTKKQCMQRYKKLVQMVKEGKTIA